MTQTIRNVILSVVIAVTGSTAPTVNAASPYRMIDLGTLGGFCSFGYGINEQGDVVGTSEAASGQLHAFLWQAGVMTDLGTLGGSFSRAFAINNRRQIVGESETAFGESHAVLWEDGTLTDLGMLGGPQSWASSINERGQIVGTVTLGSARRAVLWHKGEMVDLGTLGGSFGYAIDINSRGDVVGISGDEANHSMRSSGGPARWSILGYLWAASLVRPTASTTGARWLAPAIHLPGNIMPCCGAPVPRSTWARWAAHPAAPTESTTGGRWWDGGTPPQATRAHFFWQDGEMTDMGTLGGTFTIATGINNRGQAVGYSARHAFLWTR
jgi:probable HAF family extracellular repeat protein